MAAVAVTGGVAVMVPGGGAVVTGGRATAVAVVGVGEAVGATPVAAGFPGDIAAGIATGLADADVRSAGSSGGTSPFWERSGSSVV
jgi:hypothetical protein